MTEQMANDNQQAKTERIDSPDKLNDYMRVLSPPVWLIIIAVLLLMVGFLTWAVFGNIEVHDIAGNELNVSPITFVTG